MSDPYVEKATNDKLTPQQKIDGLKEILDITKTGMLTTRGTNGELHSRAMAPASLDGLHFTFIVNNQSHKTDEMESDPHVNVSFFDPGSNHWVSVAGTAKVLQDKKRAKELWNPFVSAWFGDLGDGVHKGDSEDPRVSLIDITPTEIRYWYSTRTKVGAAVEVATSAITGKVASPGELRTITPQETIFERPASAENEGSRNQWDDDEDDYELNPPLQLLNETPAPKRVMPEPEDEPEEPEEYGEDDGDMTLSQLGRSSRRNESVLDEGEMSIRTPQRNTRNMPESPPPSVYSRSRTAAERREEQLHAALFQLRKINSVLGDYVGALEAVDANTERLERQVERTNAILDRYVRMLDQQEQTSKLYLTKSGAEVKRPNWSVSGKKEKKERDRSVKKENERRPRGSLLSKKLVNELLNQPVPRVDEGIEALSLVEQLVDEEQLGQLQLEEGLLLLLAPRAG
ncbi:pyridoxamine 5'-phosphate oxidase family protein [Rhizoctonia solani]|uniref:Pyridoxamine 5'-phosphate oxidase family protein n=1 Tax=Rhizoctonia solani TaxID=456999 RepID=A0A8H8NZF8_9AGAM|nr:pyridoxamine 5'-phosphate oxidase family protein [Rhizoctonia solani]QRW21738.1 pyridoxamine 5'-phosphate oxidase family protein [Rhizoctonia solani]